MGKLIINNIVASKLFLGSTEINKAYIGNTLVYQKSAPNGVYIKRTNNLLYTSDNWDIAWNDEAIGVAVISDSHPDGGFIISKNNADSTKVYGDETLSVTGIITSGDMNTALKDFSGRTNTDNILNQDETYLTAAYFCAGHSFPNGYGGYLGALGEWDIAYQNKPEVDKCMEKIGGVAISTSYPYWASTQASANRAWIFRWSDGVITSGYKSDTYNVRPFKWLN